MTTTPTSKTYQSINRVIEDDYRQHIEDTRLFLLFRHGKPVRLSWNELTATERQQQIAAQERAAYNVTFSIY
jgi:hypothetical protein